MAHPYMRQGERGFSSSSAPEPAVISSTELGVPTDGTDAAATLTRAAVAAASRGLKLVLDGAHTILSTVTLPAGSDVEIREPLNATALASGVAAFSAAGSVTGSPYTLAANATAGAIQFQVTPGQEVNFLAGDTVHFTAQTYWAGSGPSGVSGVDAYIGEYGFVKTAPTPGSGIVLLRTPLALTYATSATATVSRIAMVESLTIATTQNGVILCGGNALNQRGIFLDRVRNATLDVRVDKAEDQGVLCVDCINVHVRLSGDGGGAHTNSTFYGCSFQGCQDAWFEDSPVARYKHAVTCSGSTVRPGINFRVHYLNNDVYGTTSTGLDCHAMVVDLEVGGNLVENPGNEADDEGDLGGGISIRCPSANLWGNRVKGTNNYGVWLRNQSSQPTNWTLDGDTIATTAIEGVKADLHTPLTAGRTIDFISLNGVKVRNAGTSGSFDAIHVFSSNTDRLSVVEVNGCSTNGSTGYGVHVELTDGLVITGGVHVKNALGTVKLEGCTVFAVSGMAGSAPSAGVGKGVFIVGSSSGGSVTGNTFSGFAFGLQADNTTSHILLGPNTLLSCTTPVSDNGTANRTLDGSGTALNLIA